MDDISSTVHHKDLQFFRTETEKLGLSRGCFVNPQKTRILTLCLGGSIIPSIATTDKALAQELTITNTTQNTPSRKTTMERLPIERTDVFRLLGTPVGSASFARTYYNKQLLFNSNNEADKLTERIPDLHTHLKLFSQCTVNKLPHLLDSGVTHNHTPEFDNSQWYNWNGHLTQGIDDITQNFLKRLLDIPSFTQCKHQISTGLRHQYDDLLQIHLTRFQAEQGYHSHYPTRFNCKIVQHTSKPRLLMHIEYNQLLPHRSPICNGPKSQHETNISHFESHISPHSARDCIKTFCGLRYTSNKPNSLLYCQNRCTRTLTSLTKHPLTTNFIPFNWNESKQPSSLTTKLVFFIAAKRKLCLPIFNPNNLPLCKCNRQHDCYGDHIFNCRNISKKMTHIIIRYA